MIHAVIGNNLAVSVTAFSSNKLQLSVVGKKMINLNVLYETFDQLNALQILLYRYFK